MDPIIPPPMDTFGEPSSGSPSKSLGSQGSELPSTNQPPVWPQQSPGSSGKTIAIIGGIVGLLVVIGAVGAGFWWMRRPLDAQTVFSRYLQKASDLHSFHTAYRLNTTITGEQKAGLDALRSQGSGDIDLSAGKSPKVSMNQELTLQFAASSPAATIGLTDVSVAMEFRSSDQKNYVQFVKLPTIGFFSLSPLLNRWIALPNSAGTTTINTDQIAQSLKSVFTAADLFMSPESLGMESIDGVNTYHIRVQLNGARAAQLIEAIASSAGSTDPTAVKMRHDNIIPALTGLRPELWIANNDFTLRKMILPVQYTDQSSGIHLAGSFEQTFSAINAPMNFAPPTDAKSFQEVMKDVLGPLASSMGSGLPAGLASTLGTTPAVPSGQGSAPAVNAPDSDFDGLPDAVESQLGTDPFNADTDHDNVIDGEEVNKYHTNPLKADTDGDGLTDGEEIFRWHTDPLKPDTDGDGYTDGQEVRNGYNPIGEGKMTPEQLRLRGK